MKRRKYSRREFLKAGVGVAAGMLSASVLGCSGGSGTGGSILINPTAKDWSYLGQRGITAVFRTTDSTLYRELLPTTFQMPDTLQFAVTIVSYYDVTKPLAPYHEGYVALACNYRGQGGWYILTMPVDDKTANDAGISLGFPKYIADRITLERSGSAWNGQVIHQGRSVMQMTFTPQGGEAPVSTRSSDPGLSCFNLVPPGVGPEIVEVRKSISGTQQVTTTTGAATVKAAANEPWGRLLGGATPVSAQFAEETGNYTLVSVNGEKTAVVSIARIRNGRIDLAVEEAIALLGGMSEVTRDRQRIMLKPNLVSESPNATTNPEVVKSLARLMQGAGKEVLIGEGSAGATGFNITGGVAYRTKKPDLLDGMQQYVFDSLGYTQLGRDLGIPLINLHTGDMVPVAVPDGFVFQTISLHRSLTEIDLLCSVPMMKTHILGGVTLGMKNLIGTYPGQVYGSVRSLIHDQAAGAESSGTAAAVVDIMRANRLGLVVVDASTAMEGDGPFAGSPVKMDLIIAGTNPLATDMVAASVMGFQPSEISTFLWANKAGMQPQSLTQIEIRGEPIATVQRRFVRPNIVSWSAARPSFGATEI